MNLTPTHLPTTLADNTPISGNTMQEGNWRKILAESYRASKKWLNQQENKGLKLALIILVGCIVTMFWYFNAQFKEFQQMSQVRYYVIYIYINIDYNISTFLKQ